MLRYVQKFKWSVLALATQLYYNFKIANVHGSKGLDFSESHNVCDKVILCRKHDLTLSIADNTPVITVTHYSVDSF